MNTTQDLLEKRYLHPGEKSWEDITVRVARFLYDDERAIDLYEAIRDKTFIPSSPVLMNAGARYPMMCSCFVLPVEDNIEAIMRTLTNTVLIQKYGGGVGINFSPIRADGSVVTSTNGRASGPVSFMGFWNAGMDIIRQGGKRQGAMMGVLNVDHPDLPLFLRAKDQEGKLTNFNLSVGLTDEFMARVKAGNDDAAYTIFRAIAAYAWMNGEPGVLFLDHLNRGNPYGIPIVATNPCGEVPLPPYGACCLGSINLKSCLVKEDGRYRFDWDKLERLTKLGVETLNAVIDKSWWPVKETEDFMLEHRPIGLGVMGLADTLALLGLPYDSSEGRIFASRVLQQMASHARLYGPDNATHLSIAPTGTISMLAGCSYSIEPHFAYTYQKTTEAGVFDGDDVWIAEEVARLHGYELTISDRTIINMTGSLQTTNAPKVVKDILKTANEIHSYDHIQMQVAVQTWVDNAVSKTVNLPYSASVEDIAMIIQLAHTLGLKGLTVYRDKSREAQVITQGCASGKCEL